jgi:hypothetical protein
MLLKSPVFKIMPILSFPKVVSKVYTRIILHATVIMLHLTRRLLSCTQGKLGQVLRVLIVRTTILLPLHDLAFSAT